MGAGGVSNVTAYTEVLKVREGHLGCQGHLTPDQREGWSQTAAITAGVPGFCCRQGPPASVEKQYVTFTWFPTSLYEGVLMDLSPFLVCSNMSFVWALS